MYGLSIIGERIVSGVQNFNDIDIWDKKVWKRERIDTIIIPVNTQGVMGAGLAKQAKQKYPLHCKDYFLACKKNRLKIGNMVVSKKNSPRILFIPTKTDWKLPSEYEYIIQGLNVLQQFYSRIKKPNKIAVPMLGCGLGGLDVDLVDKIMTNKLMKIRQFHTFIFYSNLKDWSRNIKLNKLKKQCINAENKCRVFPCECNVR